MTTRSLGPTKAKPRCKKMKFPILAVKQQTRNVLALVEASLLLRWEHWCAQQSLLGRCLALVDLVASDLDQLTLFLRQPPHRLVVDL